jgi:2-phospho-L-lactate guanylyltransferase
MTTRRVWAAVPYKGPVGSKRRLAPLLTEDERARLSLAMLDDVLDALLGTPGIERILLLTPWECGHPFAALRASSGHPGPGGQDGRAPRGYAGERLTIVDETPQPVSLSGHDNLNGALRQAQAVATAGGADALLIMPADLPHIAPESVAALLEAATDAGVVLAPDRADDGTNALVLSPPTAIAPSFGGASFGRHRDLARQADRRQAVVRRPELGLDLDTSVDVELLLASGQECRAVRLLRELDIAGRLSSLAATQARSTTI